MTTNLKALAGSDPGTANLAAKMREDERKLIAGWVCDSYDTDKRGRSAWEEKRNRWYKLWLMHREPKNDPWPNASNVCLPILAIACNQFHARSYQAMTSAPEVVQALPTGPNDVARARHVRGFMNWQIMHEMEEWDEEHDKVCLGVPLNGTAFKKYTYSRQDERPVSEYVSSMNIILPYRTKSLKTARRLTHEVWKHYDEFAMVSERNKGFYVDFSKVSQTPSGPPPEDLERTKDEIETQAETSEERPIRFLECHAWYKRASDKFFEPYIFTVDYDSQTLLRATSRKTSVRGKEYVGCHFVDYHFIPNPEGYYSFGFGHFLEVINEMANTAFNQIFDAGRISNQPFGFYGRRLGIKKREMKLWPGRMEEVEDASQIYFPNMQRVDQVLFQVLGIIQQYAEQFTSTSDYLLGREAKGTKTPTASGTLAIIEQGLILYTVMIKRLFRSFKKELGLVYTMDQLYLPEEKQYRVMETQDYAFPKIKRADFEGKLDIVPVGDPSYASKLTRRQEAQEVYMGILNNPLIGVKNPEIQIQNPEAIYMVTKRWLETYDWFKDSNKVLPELPEPSVSPETENAMFMQGDYKEPKVGEDHRAHLQSHQVFKTTPAYASMPPEYKALVDKHILQTGAIIYLEEQQRAAMGGGPAVLAPGAMGGGMANGPAPAQPVPVNGAAGV